MCPDRTQTYIDCSFHPLHSNPLLNEDSTLAMLLNACLNPGKLAMKSRLKINIRQNGGLPNIYSQTHVDCSFHPLYSNPLSNEDSTLAMLLNASLNPGKLAMESRLKINIYLGLGVHIVSLINARRRGYDIKGHLRCIASKPCSPLHGNKSHLIQHSSFHRYFLGSPETYNFVQYEGLLLMRPPRPGSRPAVE